MAQKGRKGDFSRKRHKEDKGEREETHAETRRRGGKGGGLGTKEQKRGRKMFVGGKFGLAGGRGDRQNEGKEIALPESPVRCRGQSLKTRRILAKHNVFDFDNPILA